MTEDQRPRCKSQDALADFFSLPIRMEQNEARVAEMFRAIQLLASRVMNGAFAPTISMESILRHLAGDAADDGPNVLTTGHVSEFLKERTSLTKEECEAVETALRRGHRVEIRS